MSAPRPSPLVAQLALAGFPTEALDAEEAAGISCLADAFALYPRARALPRTPGSLIAVVAPRGRALTLAREVAATLAVPATEIARIERRRSRTQTDAHLVAHNAAEAADLSPGWRRDRIGIVAVSAGAPEREAGWLRDLLRALAPSMTLAVASATTKAEDVASWCEAVGGVDGLLLEDVELTLTPAAVLANGLLVATLDGVDADPDAWAGATARALARRSGEA